jgi:hypothetical protein
MAYVSWPTRTLYIDQSELTEVTAGVVYSMETDYLYYTIHDLQDDAEGMVNPDLMFHSQPYTLSGVTYARAVEIINGYVIQFTGPASPNDHYTVVLQGGNNNVADVFIPNPVTVISNNSAGLAVATGAKGVWEHQIEPGYTAEQEMRIQSASLAGKLSGADTGVVKIRDLNDTKDRIDSPTSLEGNRISVTLDGS